MSVGERPAVPTPCGREVSIVLAQLVSPGLRGLITGFKSHRLRFTSLITTAQAGR